MPEYWDADLYQTFNYTNVKSNGVVFAVIKKLE